MISIGYTVEELETVLGYETLAEVPYPLDSDVWKGGLVNLAIFNVNHRMCYMDGPPLNAIVDTPELQLSPGKRQFITAARPLVDGETPPIAVAIGTRERLQNAVTWHAQTGVNELGVCPQRASGRYVRARTIIYSADGIWTEITGVELDAVQQGRR